MARTGRRVCLGVLWGSGISYQRVLESERTVGEEGSIVTPVWEHPLCCQQVDSQTAQRSRLCAGPVRTLLRNSVTFSSLGVRLRRIIDPLRAP